MVFLAPVILLIVEEVCVGGLGERERESARRESASKRASESERERERDKSGRQGTFEAGRHLIRSGPYETNLPTFRFLRRSMPLLENIHLLLLLLLLLLRFPRPPSFECACLLLLGALHPW